MAASLETMNNTLQSFAGSMNAMQGKIGSMESRLDNPVAIGPMSPAAAAIGNARHPGMVQHHQRLRQLLDSLPENITKFKTAELQQLVTERDIDEEKNNPLRKAALEQWRATGARWAAGRGGEDLPLLTSLLQ